MKAESIVLADVYMKQCINVKYFGVYTCKQRKEKNRVDWAI